MFQFFHKYVYHCIYISIIKIEWKISGIFAQCFAIYEDIWLRFYLCILVFFFIVFSGIIFIVFSFFFQCNVLFPYGISIFVVSKRFKSFDIKRKNENKNKGNLNKYPKKCNRRNLDDIKNNNNVKLMFFYCLILCESSLCTLFIHKGK